MPRLPSFIGGSYPSNSALVAQRTVNLYVERNQEPGAENAEMLCPTPGYATWATLSDVSARGAISAAGRYFWVSGGGFYELFSDMTFTKWGTVVQDSNPAQLIFNGVSGGQIGICSGGNIYTFTLSSSTLSGVIIGGGFTHLAFAAGFGLAFNPTNGQTRLSNLQDLSTWDAGTFFKRSLFADPQQAMFVDSNNLVWVLGTDTFEVRYNTGVGTQPFSPLSGLVGRYGIAAPFAYGLTGAGIGWLASNPEGVGQFVMTRGGVPTPVSTYGVNAAVSGYLRTSVITDAEVMGYQMEGHTFLNTSYPSAFAGGNYVSTLTYDVEGQSWANRGVFDSTTGRYKIWSPRVHLEAFGLHLVGDRTTGIIAKMDTNLTTELDGTGIVRERIAPLLTDENKRTPIDQFEVLMDMGVGTVSGQGSNPQAMFSVSTDGGRTYGNERQGSIGRMGEYRKRLYWNRIGASASIVAKLRFSDPAPTRIVDAFINNLERAA